MGPDLRAGLLAALACTTACYPDCPGKEDVDVTYEIHTDIIPDAGAILFDSDVSVTGVTVRGSQVDLEVSGLDFEGVEQDIHLSLSATPAVDVPIATGDELHMMYVQDQPLWTNTYVSFWKDGELLLGLVDQAIIVQGVTFIDPLRLAVKRGFCPQRSDNCGARERAAIRFTHPDGQKEIVFDRGTGTLLGTPSYRILVDRATLNYDTLFVPCPNRERGWLRALVARISS